MTINRNQNNGYDNSGRYSRIFLLIKRGFSLQQSFFYINFFVPVTLTVTAPGQSGDRPGIWHDCDSDSNRDRIYIYLAILHIFPNRDIITITVTIAVTIIVTIGKNIENGLININSVTITVTVSVTGTQKLL